MFLAQEMKEGCIALYPKNGVDLIHVCFNAKNLNALGYKFTCNVK